MKPGKMTPKMGRASALGWELAILLVGFLGAGWWLDRRFGTEPWLLLVGLGLGSFASIRVLMKAAKLIEDEDEG